MSKLCIIPARSGSKRIPKKNVKHFLGKPIIAYSIETALESGLFTEVMVSTDSEDIADIAMSYGASVPFMRSNSNSDDFSTLSDVIEEVWGCYQAVNKAFDALCCILPTSPLVKVESLKRGLEEMKKGGFDSMRPLVRFSYPIQRSFKLSATGKIDFFFPEYKESRSQDLEIAYHDAGQFYWMDSDKRLIGQNKGAFEISEMESQDIDTIVDWEIAEIKYKLSNEGAI